MAEVIYKDNDHIIELLGLQDGSTLAYINGTASVLATLKDKDGNALTGQTWPLTMNYVASTNGDYRGILEDTLVLSPGAIYTAEILVDAGSGLKARWDVVVQADLRR